MTQTRPGNLAAQNPSPFLFLSCAWQANTTASNYYFETDRPNTRHHQVRVLARQRLSPGRRIRIGLV